MLNELDFSAIIVTIKLAIVSTSILILIGTPIAWWLSQTKFKFKAIFEAIIALPLILPPTGVPIAGQRLPLYQGAFH